MCHWFKATQKFSKNCYLLIKNVAKETFSGDSGGGEGGWGGVKGGVKLSTACNKDWMV